MSKADYTVFILRAEPLTVAHEKLIMEGFKLANKVIVVFGSHKASKTIKNPWSYVDRVQMLRNAMNEQLKEIDKNLFDLITVPLRDSPYDDNCWISSLQNEIRRVTGNNSKVVLIGHFKDQSSRYLKWFPQYYLNEQLAVKVDGKIVNATDVRDLYFELSPTGCVKIKEIEDSKLVSKPVLKFLEDFSKTSEYSKLCQEYAYIKDYKAKWTSAPFAPTLVTTDAIVVQAGHLLVVRRGGVIGNGKLALPGGYLGITETIEDSMLRELYEETQIVEQHDYLRSKIRSSKVFDHPNRSVLGRSITHAYFIELDGDRPLPNVKGADDASEAFWMPFNDIYNNEEQFHDDHVHILNYFLRYT